MGHVRSLFITTLAAVASVTASAAFARSAALDVHIDENTVVDLAAPAGNVVIGNPAIADVNLINPRRMAILGRSYGLTNIIVLDQMGRAIFRREINVAAAPTGRISLYRGVYVNNFACAPHCERTPMPGEEKQGTYSPYSDPYKDYSDRSKPDASAQGPTGSP
jgi:hypothetical protein